MVYLSSSFPYCARMHDCPHQTMSGRSSRVFKVTAMHTAILYAKPSAPAAIATARHQRSTGLGRREEPVKHMTPASQAAVGLNFYVYNSDKFWQELNLSNQSPEIFGK